MATSLLDSGLVPIDQVQKFLGHMHLPTTQIYAETSLGALGENYIRALGGKLTPVLGQNFGLRYLNSVDRPILEFYIPTCK
jgi:hypothetical protein